MKRAAAQLSMALILVGCGSSDSEVPKTPDTKVDAATGAPQGQPEAAPVVTPVTPREAATDPGTPEIDAGSTVEVVDASSPRPTAVDAEASAPMVVAGDGGFTAWTKRSKITITDAALKEDQTDFQVPIKLDATAFDFGAARSNGEDLRFVDDAGNTLKYQIDAWDPSGSLIWLRLPKLTAAPIIVWLYYGNAAATPPSDADQKAVWPAPYAGVWHLSGDSKDATAHAFDGATTTGGSYAAAKFGRGFKLDGAKHDHIDLKTNIKILGGAAGCTFSAWINPNNIENTVNGMVIMTLGKWFTNNHNSYADFNVNASGQMISHIDPGTNTGAGGYARINSDSGFIKASEWAWVTYVIDLAGSQERFFKNGQLVSTKPPPDGTFPAKTFIDMVSSRTVIGTEEDNVDHWYTGSMDELRIETAMRSTAWIAAQYRAMTETGFVKVEKDR